MSKKLGMIEILNNFYAQASPDASEMITRHAVRCNKDVQAKSGKTTTRVNKPRAAKVEAIATNGADKEAVK